MALVIGNVIIIERENGHLANLRIGDIVEMSRRILESKEFTPFLDVLK
jgi:hypothetical protein